MSIGNNTLSVLHTESASAHTQHMATVRSNHAATNHIVRASAAKQFDEPSPIQAKAVEKVLRSTHVKSAADVAAGR